MMAEKTLLNHTALNVAQKKKHMKQQILQSIDDKFMDRQEKSVCVARTFRPY